MYMVHVYDKNIGQVLNPGAPNIYRYIQQVQARKKKLTVKVELQVNAYLGFFAGEGVLSWGWLVNSGVGSKQKVVGGQTNPQKF